MSKPATFSLSTMPRPAVYGILGVLLAAAVAVWYLFLSQGAQDNTAATPGASPSTATTATAAPATPASSATNPVTSGATSPAGPSATSPTDPSATSPGSPNATSPSATAPLSTPSRSLDVQPVPFLITTAAPTTASAGQPAIAGVTAPSQPAGAAPDMLAVNPFQPLSLPPVEASPGAQSSSVANAQPAAMAPNSSTAPAFTRQPIPVTVSPASSAAAAPSGQARFPTLGQIIGQPPTTQAATRDPATPQPTSSTLGQPRVSIAPTLPRVIASARAIVRAPRSVTRASGLPRPLAGGALPVAPGLLQEAGVASARAPIAPSNLPNVQPVLPVLTVTPDAPLVVEAGPGPTPSIVSNPLPTSGAATVNATASALQIFVKQNSLSFQTVVLGPVNTAVLGTKDGLLVLPLGAAVGQSSVIVKSISADAVVLRLGDETLTLAMGGAR